MNTYQAWKVGSVGSSCTSIIWRPYKVGDEYIEYLKRYRRLTA